MFRGQVRLRHILLKHRECKSTIDKAACWKTSSFAFLCLRGAKQAGQALARREQVLNGVRQWLEHVPQEKPSDCCEQCWKNAKTILACQRLRSSSSISEVCSALSRKIFTQRCKELSECCEPQPSRARMRLAKKLREPRGQSCLKAGELVGDLSPGPPKGRKLLPSPHLSPLRRSFFKVGSSPASTAKHLRPGEVVSCFPVACCCTSCAANLL